MSASMAKVPKPLRALRAPMSRAPTSRMVRAARASSQVAENSFRRASGAGLSAAMLCGEIT